jgi:predicted MFS family arabinose efflux permease
MAHAITARDEWRAHAPLVLVAMVGFSFQSIGTFTIGLFIDPLQQEFGWTRAQITAGILLSSVISVVLSPFVGALIDRYGTRPLALPGLLASALAFAGFSLANGSMAQWLGLWTFSAFVTLLIKPAIWTTAVSSVFSTSRSLALGVTLCGTALAQILAPPLARLLIADFGWRQAYVGLAIGWGLPTLLLAAFFLFDAHAHKRRLPRQPAAVPSEGLTGLSIREAVRSPALWRIGLATLVSIGFGVAAIVHLVPILIDSGVSRENAAYLASLSGVAGICGKLLTGLLMDRFDAGWVASLTMSVAAIGFVLLLEPLRTPTFIVLAMVITGYASGTKTQMCAYLTSRYGGMRNFGKIFGVMSSIIILGSGLGPMLAGAAYDYQGSYNALIIGGIPSSLIAGLLLVGLGPYPDWSKPDREGPVRR